MDSNDPQQTHEQKAQATTKKKQRHAGDGRSAGYWFAWIAGLLLAGSLFANLVLVIVTMALAAGSAESGGGVDEEVILEGEGDRRILVIELAGVISEEGQSDMFGERPSPVDRILSQLDQARDDERVAAVVLLLNTPGGGVTASDRIHRAIARYRAESGVPVIAQMGGICASGGYYVAMACDEVYAAPTTVTGSIGVIMSLMNAETLFADKLGIRATPIVSGKHKDIASPFRSMSTEEQAILQDIVDRMYGRFVDLIVANRSAAGHFAGSDEGSVRERVLAQADGRVLHAAQALEVGLVDGLQYRDECYQRVRDRIGAKAPVIRYRKKPSGLGALLAGAAPQDPVTEMGRSLDAVLAPRFEYRWMPGLSR